MTPSGWINEQMAHEVGAGGPGGRLCYDALSLQASVTSCGNTPQ